MFDSHDQTLDHRHPDLPQAVVLHARTLITQRRAKECRDAMCAHDCDTGGPARTVLSTIAMSVAVCDHQAFIHAAIRLAKQLGSLILDLVCVYVCVCARNRISTMRKCCEPDFVREQSSGLAKARLMNLMIRASDAICTCQGLRTKQDRRVRLDLDECAAFCTGRSMPPTESMTNSTIYV